MNNSKEQTGKEGKSAEEYSVTPTTPVELLADIEVYRAIRSSEGAIRAINLYTEHCVQQRIAELESQIQQLEPKFTELEMECKRLKAELKRKDEALLEIKKLDEWGDYRQIAIECVKIAEQALKLKDI